MRIIVDISPLTSLPITGIGKILENLIDELQERDDITLTSFALVARGLLPGLKKTYPELKAPAIPARISRAALHFAQTVSLPIDFIAGPADAVISFAWLCLPLKSGKTVAIIADATPITDPQWHREINIELFKKRLRSIKKNADVVAAISEATKKELINSTNIEKEKIVVAYPGVPKAFNAEPTKSTLRRIKEKYNLPNDFLLFVGTQEPRKNLESLIKAFAGVDNKIRKQTKLVLVGDKGWGRKNSRPSFVQELGFIPDDELPSIFVLSHGLVFPSLKEGFGLPIVEAFATGIPVLTSNRSSMAEISKGAAILVNPESQKSIQHGLEQLLRLDAKTKNELVREGKKRSQEFSFKKMADKIIQEIKRPQ